MRHVRRAATPPDAKYPWCTRRVFARSGYEPSWPPSNFARAPEHRRPSPLGSEPWAMAPVAPAPRRRRRDSTRMVTTAPQGENRTATSEPCPEADSENLGLVETLLPDRIGEIQSDRTNRGLPRHPDTGAHASCRALFDLRLDTPSLRQLGRSQHDIRRFDLVQCAEISKDTSAQPELLG